MRLPVTPVLLVALAAPGLASAQALPPVTGSRPPTGAPAPPAVQLPTRDTPGEDRSADAGQPTGRADQTLRVGGWLRASLELNPAASNRPEGPVVPRDDLATRELLFVRSRYTRGRSFEAVGSALVSLALVRTLGRPSSDEWRGDVAFELREAYIGFATGPLDVRVGRQRIAWGHGDVFSPNDVIGAVDSRDPILAETGFRQVPTAALRVDLALADRAVQVVVEPVLEPDRYDVYGPNWALVQPGAPAGYRGLLAALSRGTAATGEALLVDPPRPRRLTGTQAGLRIDWHRRGTDVTSYYQYGFHGMPRFHLGGDTSLLDALDWTEVPSHQAEALAAMLQGSGTVTATWARRHHVGLDVVTTTGPFVLRVDAAYEHPALFYDRRFNAWLSPTSEAVVGVEYQTGTTGRTLIIEGRYRHIDRAPADEGLLFTARNAVDAALLARWTVDDIQFELRGLVGADPRSLVLRPQIAWIRGASSVRAGAIVMGGDPYSFGGWYRRNHGMYVIIRRDF